MTEPTPPAEPIADPFNSTELRRQLGIDGDDPSAVLPYLSAAQAVVEALIDQPFSTFYDGATQTYTIPPDLRQAVIMCAAGMYEERDRWIIPTGVMQLVGPYRSWPV